MDYKKTNAPTNTVTRDLMELCEDTGNIYETVARSESGKGSEARSEKRRTTTE